MADDEPSTDIDFIRFLGVRIVDADSDERAAKVVEGAASLGLRADASLLAVSNRYGAIFIGTADGFKWAWLAELRDTCAAGCPLEQASGVLHTVSTAGDKPFSLSLNADSSRLALVHADKSVALFDLLALFGGKTTPAATTSRAQPPKQFMWSPAEAGKALALDEDGALSVLSLAEGAAAGFAPGALTIASANVCYACFSLDGTTLLCGMADGKLVRYPVSGGAADELSGPPAEASEGSLRLILPLTDKRVLCGYHRADDDPYFALVDVTTGAMQECGDACFGLGREDPDGGDEPPPRAFYAVGLPDWRMAVVCTSDSDQVVSFGSRKGGEQQRWQVRVSCSLDPPPTAGAPPHPTCACRPSVPCSAPSLPCVFALRPSLLTQSARPINSLSITAMGAPRRGGPPCRAAI